MDTGKIGRAIIDVHSHILPQMDDGSESGATSAAMLRASAEQGIRYMVATPHFYAGENNPEQFLRRREVSAARLRELWQPDMPRLLLGAEVHYFEGIGRVKQMDDLRIEGTRLLLLEMPFRPWTDRMLSEVQVLNQRREIMVVLAHIERYMRWQRANIWDELADCGILMQCNASFFLRWQTRHKALRLLREGRVQFVGSDCHNMTTRPPQLGKALSVLKEHEVELLVRVAHKYFPELAR